MSTEKPKVSIEHIEMALANPEPLEMQSPPALVWDAITENIMQPDKAQAPANSQMQRRSKLSKTYFGLAAAFILFAGLAIAYSFESSPTAELVAMGEFDGTGVAKLSDDKIQLDVEDLQAPDGHNYELWLLSVDSAGEVVDLVSLGDLDGNEFYSVPGQTDLNAFSVVDISLEPDDGDDTHSGNSVLRGELI